jgi:hypothetical protein
MEEFKEFRRRIRPELSDEILRLFVRDTIGFENDPQEISGEKEAQEKAIAAEFNRTHPGLTAEKALWALDQQLQLWEDTAVKLGKLFSTIKTHETPERYLGALKQIGSKTKISEELANAYIQAYKEDLKNG